MTQHEQLQQAARFALEVLLWTQAGEPVPSMEREAIKQLKTALQEPVEEHERWCASVTQLLLCDPPRKAPCNCKKKQAEPVEEPVAWANMKDGEPVLLSISQHPEDRANWRNPIPLYTAPPQRKPLQDDEVIAAIKNISFNEMTAFNIARAIERQHGIV